MQTNYLIAVTDFCKNHDIEISFIRSLQNTGLIEITTVETISYVDKDQLQELEKFVRFYYELNINLEGIETITHLLKRVNILHDENKALHNKLRLYE